MNRPKAKHVLYGMVFSLPVFAVIGIAINKIELLFGMMFCLFGGMFIIRPRLIFEYIIEEGTKPGREFDPVLSENMFKFISIIGGLFLIAFALYIWIKGF